jgi:hypothetical protein
MVGKAHPLGGESVDMGRFDLGLSVTTQVTVAQIVSHDEDDIGLIWGASPRAVCAPRQRERRRAAKDVL